MRRSPGTEIVSVMALAVILLICADCKADSPMFNYDELDRLKWVQYDDGTVISWDYDKAGNRTAQNVYSASEAAVTITAAVSGSGAVYPSGTVRYIPIRSQTFYFEPKNSSLVKVLIDGAEVGPLQYAGSGMYYYTVASGQLSTAPHTLQANFTENTNPDVLCPPVLLQPYNMTFATIQSAIFSAQQNYRIVAYARNYAGSVVMDRPVYLTLYGGFPCSYSGYEPTSSTIVGSLIITNGTLNVANIIIQ